MPLDLRLSPENPNTRQHSETAFQEGGAWDQNQGAKQTRLFAECFHKHTKVPFAGEFSVLDIGCALGDALPVWKQHYPQARLFGCDVAQSAISRCRERYGTVAEFFVAGFEDVQGTWEVIYCSNVLEHFEQHVEIADALLAHCRVLYIMTPYAEIGTANTQGSFHVASFFEGTFEKLVDQDCCTEIGFQIIDCPHTWDPQDCLSSRLG